MRFVGLLAALLLVASPAAALTIQAPAAQELVIEHTWEKLSPCVQDHIIHAHLQLIKVKPKHALGTDKNYANFPPECLNKTDEHPTLHVQAISLKPAHKIVIDGAYVVPSVIMHEFGHWFEDDVIWHTYEEAWDRAVELDVADMQKCDAYDNAYLKSPIEAAAQIFAAQELGKSYNNEFYDVSGFRRSNAMMAEILEKTCPTH